MNILSELSESSKKTAFGRMKIHPPKEMRKAAEGRAIKRRKDGEAFRFERALKEPGFHVIAELKKASPSKGMISPDFPYLEILSQYEQSGASCISVLTETEKFLGSLEIFDDVRAHTDLALLRKDFITLPYQIDEAAAHGADAVLLIMAVLDDRTFKTLFDRAEALGMSCLVETHDEEELDRALDLGARVIGVNNRNLKNFTVDLQTTENLSGRIPENRVFISESGMLSVSDVERVKRTGADGVLIGEGLMRAGDGKLLREILK